MLYLGFAFSYGANVAIQKWRQPIPTNIKINNYGIIYINWDGLEPSDKCHIYKECIENNIKCDIEYINNYIEDDYYNNRNIYCSDYKEPGTGFNIYYLINLFFINFNLF
ncbi:hypothetical protein RFI_37417 [Reticulomyxa filosa]|uniref:Uncharacterized protein n=1 Tax=Reticulomyxa filosa TaxID=46433 RepID=X6LFX6_RETFI|nr:hypothetical protein RFI_37417 [Reticulomyxa filosa]|eukprot:ETO00042.1 hypothetical protein RFI_37417 [Reticulomyxa filosa]